MAPDTMVIFGRPKGHRGSYIQHREGGVPVQVAFEVLSRGNRAGEMRRTRDLYERYGAEEYYVLAPDHARHQGYLRGDSGRLEPIAELFGWTSPRLGVRFELGDTLRLLGPDGRPFEPYAKVIEQRERAERQAEEERERAERGRLRARDERQWAEEERRRVERLVERLVEQLRALGIEPDA